MSEIYAKTSLTRKIVALQSGFIDWDTQPSIFKHYPDFLFSYSFGEKEQLHLLELARCITSEQMIGQKPYRRLNTPSAGNLHPVEVYVQIRGIKGIISGIYHIDASLRRLSLLKEIDEDGLEVDLGLSHKFEGMLFIVSCVPFRSEWKYGERALRYCYLDAGHQIASIKAAATLYNNETTILSGFDTNELNRMMGFKDAEFVCAVLAIGEENQKTVKKLSKPLYHVMPTDYELSSGFISSLMSKESVFKSNLLDINASEESILNRRSARKFSEESMSEEAFNRFSELLGQKKSALSCYSVVLTDSVSAKGIYKEGTLIKEGDFKEEMVSLLVDQQFLKKADVINVITAEYFTPDTLMNSGAFSHMLALKMQAMDVGFTGIGAFYDAKLQEFLGTNEYILYVNAIGK